MDNLLLPFSTPAASSLEGTIKNIVYKDTAKDFAIVRFLLGNQSVITALGPLSSTAVGESLKLVGRYEEHTRYGKQFRVEQVFPNQPTTLLGIRRYLTTLKGVGEKTAQCIVDAHGISTLEIIENEPWKIASLKGVGKKRAEQFSKELSYRKSEWQLMIFLQSHGVSFGYAMKIFRTYGLASLEKIKENPYRVALEVQGIGFLLADSIAQKLGIPALSPFRFHAAIRYLLEKALEQGHCYVPKEVLIRRTIELLKVESGELEELLDSALGELVLSGLLVKERDNIFLELYYKAEQELAHLIFQKCQLGEDPKGAYDLDAAGLLLSLQQKKALELISTSRFCIITGGPGTGKTTLVRALYQGAKRKNQKIALIAPTGRAAKRLSEATSASASTIHRFLEFNPKEKSWRHHKANIDADVIVCDESSMVDLPLACVLLRSIPRRTKLVLVGDVDQLPSVGPGRILGDLIASQVVPLVRLREIFRQQQDSSIVTYAHQILQGEIPRFGGLSPQEDVSFVEVSDPAQAQQAIVNIMTDFLPRQCGILSQDAQVLSPMHRGLGGTEGLNALLQVTLNQQANKGPSLRQFFCGDRVMQFRNDYERDVWNGDIGMVSSINEEEQVLFVDFDDRRVLYKQEDLDQLDLAYAISVHKSQGSEYPVVIIPLLPQHYVLLQRNLLYTAITRAKKKVILVGTRFALQRAIREQSSSHRYTMLKERILKQVPKMSEVVRDE